MKCLCVPFAMSEQEARISAAKHMVTWHTLRFSGWHDSTVYHWTATTWCWFEMNYNKGGVVNLEA